MCLVQLKISSTSLSVRSIVMVCSFHEVLELAFFDTELMFGFVGTAGLSYAEFLHKIGNYQWQRRFTKMSYKVLLK